MWQCLQRITAINYNTSHHRTSLQQRTLQTDNKQTIYRRLHVRRERQPADHVNQERQPTRDYRQRKTCKLKTALSLRCGRVYRLWRRPNRHHQRGTRDRNAKRPNFCTHFRNAGPLAPTDLGCFFDPAPPFDSICH